MNDDRRPKFKEIGFCQISENKHLVLSQNENDELVLAQRAVIMDGDRERYYYDKGAIILKGIYKDNFIQMIKKINLE